MFFSYLHTILFHNTKRNEPEIRSYMITTTLGLRVGIARGWWSYAALHAHCRILKNGHIQHPGADMLTYSLTVVSQQRLTSSLKEYHIPRLLTLYTSETLHFLKVLWQNRLYQLSGFFMSRHDIKLKDLGKIYMWIKWIQSIVK